MSLRVLAPGTYSLVVDRGRPTTRSLGVPLGGAADVAALRIGNALVGNSPDTVALEIALSGPTLRADHDVSVCVFGAPFALQLDGTPIAAGQLFTVRAGQTLRIGGADRLARAYLCAHGGFRVPQVLGSGTAFAPVAEGDVLSCESSALAGRSLEHADADSLFGTSSDALRVVDGPQADWFETDSFYRQSFVVAPASNRMGVRLNGDPIKRQPRELVSEAVAPGAIQITNEGLPIVLGVDGQTIGGYPKIAHVIQADLDRIGQLRPGQSVRFECVSLETAEKLAANRRSILKRWLTILRIFTEP